MKTEELLESAGETAEYARIYVEQQLKYFQLESARKIAKTTSILATVAVLSFCVLLIIVFLTFALGFFIADFIGSYAVGFLIITIIYLILAGLIFYFKRVLITDPIVSLIIKEILD